MIRKIILKNFMSHRYSVIELADGLTVLAGDNNCGKSAVVAALQILCYNTVGDYMVRHGEKECSVTVETDEGHVVEWRRVAGAVSYCLDGVPVNRMGRGTPDNLHDLLRLPQVGAPDSSDSFDIHFAEQKKPIFLLDQAGSRAARFFASSSDAETLLRMQSLHRDKVRNAGSQRDQLTREIRGLDVRLTPLQAIDDIQNRLDRLDETYAEIVSTRMQWGQLNRDVEEIQKRANETQTHAIKASAVSQLQPPPAIMDTQPLQELSLSLAEWQTRLRNSRISTTTLSRLEAPPVLADTSPLERLALDIARVTARKSRSAQEISALLTLKSVPALVSTAELENISGEIETRRRQSQLEQQRAHSTQVLAPPPPMSDTNRLEEQIRRMLDVGRGAALNDEIASALGISQPPPAIQDEAALISAISVLQQAVLTHNVRARLVAALKEVTVPPLPFNIQPLAELIAHIEAAKQRVDASQECLRGAERSTAGAEHLIRAWVEANPTCPTCGAQLDADRLVSFPPSQSEGEAHEHAH